METYSKTIIQEFPNGQNIIHVPDLTDEERNKRYGQLKRAAEALLKDAERLKEEKQNAETCA